MLCSEEYRDIEEKILRGERLSRADGIRLFHCHDIAWLGALADTVRRRKCGDVVYYNVNCHVNLTNICTSRCKFCAFGRDAEDAGAYAMTKAQAIAVVRDAMRDPDLAGLHIVSGLHPTWTFEEYLDIVRALHETFPKLYIKGFTGVEITHFAKTSGLSVREVLTRLRDEAGLQAIAGGGAEILSDRVRGRLCPNKATAAEWLETMRTAQALGIRTNASMMYGHVETVRERIEHLLAIRDLQDETGGFQAFLLFPFHPAHTKLGEERQLTRVGAWEDLKMMALSRLVLDNVPHMKAFWVMLTLPIAQLALGFGADDLDGTIGEEKIIHAAGAQTGTGITKARLAAMIREAGYEPVERDARYERMGKAGETA